MKKTEKILLLLLAAALLVRVGGVPGASAAFSLLCFALALVYAGWGYRLLRPSAADPIGSGIAAGIALAASMVALPFATFVRQEPIFKLLPLANGVLFVYLLIRWGLGAIRHADDGPRRSLLLRSGILFVALAYLSYSPPNVAYRAVIITLNKGQVRLVANMHMVEAFDAFEAAYARGDCQEALRHAEQANREGRVWLFGPTVPEQTREQASSTPKWDTAMMGSFNALVRELQKRQAAEQRTELWKISRSYDELYYAHQCLAEQAELASDAEVAFSHYRAADSVLNMIPGRTGHWAERRAWSLDDMARTAAKADRYELSDSLFNASLKVYQDVKDSLDADASIILAEWAGSLAARRDWSYANYLLRIAIGLSKPSQDGKADTARWVRNRLQLVKNLISTDSLVLAGQVLAPCLGTAHSDSSLQCEVGMVKGSLEYRRNDFRAADRSFQEAVSCMDRLPGQAEAKAIAYLGWGYVKTELAQYAEARELVEKGQQVLAPLHTRSPATGSLQQLSALLHHLQGGYRTARQEYGECIRSLGSAPDRTIGAMAGLADVLMDLAEPAAGKVLADSALALLVDSLPLIRPSQAGVLNTAAYADHLLGDQPAAHQRYALVLETCTRYGATNTGTYVQALNGQALVAMATSRTASADTLFARAYALCVPLYGKEHPFTARLMINQALLRMQQGRPGEARELLLAALPTTTNVLGKDHDQLADIHRALGDIDRRQGQRAAAEVHYKEALRIYKLCFPATHPDVVAAQRLVE